MAKFPGDPLSVTPAWLSEVLGADVRHCQLEQIAIGIGLLSRVFRAHLDGGPGVPTSVVVKLPMLDTTVRSAICEDLEFYLREVRFYQEIGLADPLRPARPYFAAFDESTHDFILILEDLGRLRVIDQTVGCTAGDAETVIDAIARHHSYWWQSDRFAALPWLKTFSTPPFSAALAGNFQAAWPRFLEGVGADLSPGTACIRRAVPLARAMVLEGAHATTTHLPAWRLTTRPGVLRRPSRRPTGDGTRLADHLERPGRL